MVYQSYYLIPELTVIENVMMSVRLSKLSMKEYEERAIKLLEEMSMADKTKKSLPSCQAEKDKELPSPVHW